MKKYELTPEHREQLKPWADKWIANAMSTAAMTDDDRRISIDAVKKLYQAANLTPPPDHRIIFVPSPFVARFAGGFAAWIWYSRRNGKNAATGAATGAATDAATDAATYAATYAATDAATGAARDFSKWYILAGDMRRRADSLGVGVAGLMCAEKPCGMWQGGNQWSAYDSFLSFFRHVANLPIDYAAWDPWETLSLHSGPRIVHKDFCIISDRPEVLLIDEDNRPHCEDGPFCRWRDGSALYAVHGVYVPAWVIEHPGDITPAKIEEESNEEIRRIMIEKFGWTKYLDESGATKVHSRRNDIDTQREVLYELTDGRKRMRVRDPSTGREYALGVPREVNTCEEAQTFLSHGLSKVCIGRS